MAITQALAPPLVDERIKFDPQRMVLPHRIASLRICKFYWNSRRCETSSRGSIMLRLQSPHKQLFHDVALTQSSCAHFIRNETLPNPSRWTQMPNLFHCTQAGNTNTNNYSSSPPPLLFFFNVARFLRPALRCSWDYLLHTTTQLKKIRAK